jgi:hypothetical protein
VRCSDSGRTQSIKHGGAALILNRIGKGSRETHGKGRRVGFELIVGLRASLRVFDGDFDHEFSATGILLRPGDLCTHVTLVERRQFDVHAFCHSRSPLELYRGCSAKGIAKCNRGRRLRRPSQAGYLDRTFSARSASVSHRSAISMKKDLCSEVRAASANRMHSATLLRNCTKLSKRASISLHMGTARALCPKNVSRSKAEGRTNGHRLAQG